MMDTPVLLGTGTLTGAPGYDTQAPLEVTLSRAASPNALLLLWVNVLWTSGEGGELGVSGGGVDWEMEEMSATDQSSISNRYYLYRAQGGAPSGTTVTVSIGGASVQAATAQVVEVSSAE